MIRQKSSNILMFFTLIVLISAILTPTAFANSAEPPGLTVIVSFPPDDLSLSIRFADGSITHAVPLQKEQKAWESYYRFFYGMVAAASPSLNHVTLVVQSSEANFECVLPESSFSQYNNLLTLDLELQSILDGQSPVRQALLIAMRVILTLMIEGLIFFAFGYRTKVSWIAFVAVNLITQGALNALLTGPNLGTYWIIGFVFYEMIIFIAEMIAFSFILKEYKKGRAVAYALTANFASLILGGVLISYLPV